MKTFEECTIFGEGCHVKIPNEKYSTEPFDVFIGNKSFLFRNNVVFKREIEDNAFRLENQAHTVVYLAINSILIINTIYYIRKLHWIF